jgi:hypothetical protein
VSWRRSSVIEKELYNQNQNYNLAETFFFVADGGAE